MRSARWYAARLPGPLGRGLSRGLHAEAARRRRRPRHCVNVQPPARQVLRQPGRRRGEARTHGEQQQHGAAREERRPSIRHRCRHATPAAGTQVSTQVPVADGTRRSMGARRSLSHLLVPLQVFALDAPYSCDSLPGPRLSFFKKKIQKGGSDRRYLKRRACFVRRCGPRSWAYMCCSACTARRRRTGPSPRRPCPARCRSKPRCGCAARAMPRTLRRSPVPRQVRPGQCVAKRAARAPGRLPVRRAH